MRKAVLFVVFYVWIVFVLAAYYVVQKPIGSIQLRGLTLTLWTLILSITILITATGIGNALLRGIKPREINPTEKVLFGVGLGLGAFGLLGLGLAALGWVSPYVFAGFIVAFLLFLFFSGDLRQVKENFKTFWADISDSFKSIHILFRLAIFLIVCISALQALAPPDAFDALMYHLEFPARILKDGGLNSYDIPQFWFPSLPEGAYLWVMALGSDRATQLLHLFWTLVAALMVWKWALHWNERVAWLSVALIISMPSLPLVASWAYTDFALTALIVASLYSFFRYDQIKNRPWLILSGIFAGMAMGVKYTSFILPIVIVLLILWWGRKNLRVALADLVIFSGIALLIAAPWYIRNWILMDNPFYPFILGGLYWNSLRAALYAMAGTGIGWNIKEILLLPFTATLGYKDANYYDGRIGPLFLLSIPLIVMAYWDARQDISQKKKSLAVIGVYAIISFLLWTIGVINTRSLWQVRLLYPSLFLMTIPAALGILLLGKLDSQKIKVSSLFNNILVTVIAISLLENVYFVTFRNPLPVALGVESESKYLARVLPSYTEMLGLLEEIPTDSKTLALFEPRSYRSPRFLQPDPVVDQLARDVDAYGDAQNVVEAWRDQGYTHILLYRWGVNFLEKDPTSVLTPERRDVLNQITRKYLKLVGTTSNGDYELYAIPSQ